jgi:hypothetical protein
MTDNTQTTDAGDYRRASLLTKYHREGNETGVMAIIEETNELDRAAQLLFSLLVLHKTFIARFRTPDGIDLLADYIHGIAQLDADEPPNIDIVRAAQILEHHGHSNRKAIAEVMNTATLEGRATHTFLKLLDHYEVALPELSGQAGIAFIDANAAAMREQEFMPDDRP